MTALTSAYRRFIRAMGGRSLLPRGSRLDEDVRYAVESAAFIGACRERDHVIAVIRGVRTAEFFDSDKALLSRLEQMICETPISDIVGGQIK